MVASRQRINKKDFVVKQTGKRAWMLLLITYSRDGYESSNHV